MRIILYRGCMVRVVPLSGRLLPECRGGCSGKAGTFICFWGPGPCPRDRKARCLPVRAVPGSMNQPFGQDRAGNAPCPTPKKATGVPILAFEEWSVRVAKYVGISVARIFRGYFRVRRDVDVKTVLLRNKRIWQEKKRRIQLRGLFLRYRQVGKSLLRDENGGSCVISRIVRKR